MEEVSSLACKMASQWDQYYGMLLTVTKQSWLIPLEVTGCDFNKNRHSVAIAKVKRMVWQDVTDKIFVKVDSARCVLSFVQTLLHLYRRILT
jgi:hypothetical protein